MTTSITTRSAGPLLPNGGGETKVKSLIGENVGNVANKMTPPPRLPSNGISGHYDRATATTGSADNGNKLTSEGSFWQQQVKDALQHFYVQLEPKEADTVAALIQGCAAKTTACEDVEHAVVMLHVASKSEPGEAKQAEINELAKKLAVMIKKYGLGSSSPLGVSSKNFPAYKKAQELKNIIARLAKPASLHESSLLQEVKGVIHHYLETHGFNSAGLQAKDIFTTASHLHDEQAKVNDSKKSSSFLDLGLSNVLTVRLLALVKDILDAQAPEADKHAQPDKKTDEPDNGPKTPDSGDSDATADSTPKDKHPNLVFIDKSVHITLGDINLSGGRSESDRNVFDRHDVSTKVGVEKREIATQTEAEDLNNIVQPHTPTVKGPIPANVLRNPATKRKNDMPPGPAKRRKEDTPTGLANGSVRHWDVKTPELYRGSAGSYGYTGSRLTPDDRKTHNKTVGERPAVPGSENNVLGPESVTRAKVSANRSVSERHISSQAMNNPHANVIPGTMHRDSTGSSVFKEEANTANFVEPGNSRPQASNVRIGTPYIGGPGSSQSRYSLLTPVAGPAISSLQESEAGAVPQSAKGAVAADTTPKVKRSGSWNVRTGTSYIGGPGSSQSRYSLLTPAAGPAIGRLQEKEAGAVPQSAKGAVAADATPKVKRSGPWNVRTGTSYIGGPGSSQSRYSILTPAAGPAIGSPQEKEAGAVPQSAKGAVAADTTPKVQRSGPWNVRTGTPYIGGPGSSQYMGSRPAPNDFLAERAKSTSSSGYGGDTTHSNTVANEVSSSPKVKLKK